MYSNKEYTKYFDKYSYNLQEELDDIDSNIFKDSIFVILFCIIFIGSTIMTILNQ